MSMKNKTWIIAGAIVLIVAGFLLFGFSKPDETITDATIQDSLNPITAFSLNEGKTPLSSYEFNFEGYGPGKSHLGTFDVIEGNYVMDRNSLDYLEIKFDLTSVNTGIDGLNGHLQNEDFFEVETYPEAIFISKEIKKDSIVGDLTLKGVTKEIEIPVSTQSNQISSDFLLDVREFGIDYIGINDKVRFDFLINY